MKKFLIALALVVTSLTMVIADADARRLGGGGSFGRQSSNVSRQVPSSPSQATNAARPATPPAAVPGAVPPKPASPWRGILGGALLGLGLGALFSHLGLGGALGGMLGSILMIALLGVAAMFIYRLFQRKNAAPAPMAYAGYTPPYNSGTATPEIGSRLEPVASAAAVTPWNVPADFDSASFLRQAKTYFIRLQAAWDKAEVNDIREFTTPEMFGELRLQIQERGANPNNTDVVTLDAELLGLETSANDYLASVKFSGMIREADHAPTEPFTEVWNLSKPVSGNGGWVLAGIQQLA